MNNLSKLRRDKGLTQAQESAELKIAQSTLSGWETGKFEVDNANLFVLSKYFDVSIDYILGRVDTKKPPVSEDDERLKEVLANVSEETREAIELLDQLSPDNLARAKEYIRFELARQEGAGDKQ